MAKTTDELQKLTKRFSAITGEYIPTTEEVRQRYWDQSRTHTAYGEFDRWLAAHEKQVIDDYRWEQYIELNSR